MRWNSASSFPIDVQFEDIDGGGVVHHPNYLRYLERARCQAMREIGVPFEKCLQDGVAFVVAEFNGKYLKPLTFGQRVYVVTYLAAIRKSSLKIYQKIIAHAPTENSIERSGDNFFSPEPGVCFFAQLRLVAVDLKSGRPIPVPESLRNAGGCPSAQELNSSSSATDVRLGIFLQD